MTPIRRTRSPSPCRMNTRVISCRRGRSRTTLTGVSRTVTYFVFLRFGLLAQRVGEAGEQAAGEQRHVGAVLAHCLEARDCARAGRVAMRLANSLIVCAMRTLASAPTRCACNARSTSSRRMLPLVAVGERLADGDVVVLQRAAGPRRHSSGRCRRSPCRVTQASAGPRAPPAQTPAAPGRDCAAASAKASRACSLSSGGLDGAAAHGAHHFLDALGVEPPARSICAVRSRTRSRIACSAGIRESAFPAGGVGSVMSRLPRVDAGQDNSIRGPTALEPGARCRKLAAPAWPEEDGGGTVPALDHRDVELTSLEVTPLGSCGRWRAGARGA